MCSPRWPNHLPPAQAEGKAAEESQDFPSGVRATSATIGSLGALAMPPTATILAAVVLNQQPTLEIVFGQLLLMVAMAVTIVRTARGTGR